MANTQQQMPGTKDCTSCPAILNSTHHINKALIHNETENPLPRAWQKKKKKETPRRTEITCNKKCNLYSKYVSEVRKP